jgi:PIN domain nuclease of toxin-antitoxin system
VRLLADTHAMLWFVGNDPHLSPGARAAMADPANTVSVSVASFWEVAVKVSIGKLTLPVPLQEIITAVAGYGMAVEEVLPSHTVALAALPFHHKDPFDRLMIAQATWEKLPIISADATFDDYGVARLW